MSEEKTIKTAIKNMNIYLDECHDDNDTITMAAKVLRSIRDNYCELLRYKAAVEGMNAIIQRNNSKLDLQADYKTLYEDLKAEHIETIKAIKYVKSEAVRSFAKECKDYVKSFTGMFSPQLGFTVSLDAVLNAVDFVCEKMTKEMVGDENGIKEQNH